MVLKEIQKILEKEEFSCTYLASTEKAPLDRLLVFLGADVKERERLIEISAAQQQVVPEFLLPTATSLPIRIQFRHHLPFKVQDLALNQVASLLLYLNQFIDLPGFELDEVEGQVVYRYVWLIKQEAIDSTLVMNIIGSIMINLSLFSETIESLADGSMSFNELLAQIVALADKQSQPVPPKKIRK